MHCQFVMSLTRTHCAIQHDKRENNVNMYFSEPKFEFVLHTKTYHLSNQYENLLFFICFKKK